MMNLLLSIIFLAIVLLAYLLVGLRKPNRPNTQFKHDDSAHEREIRALISQYEEDKVALENLPDSEQALRLSELETRLYKELKPFIHQTQQKNTGTPSWAYAVIVAVVAIALGAWYLHGGHFVWQWQQLDKRMDSALTRSQLLDELPEQMPPEMMSTYCLALQSRIDRNDLNQLDTLAQCVASYGNYANARKIYEYIYRKNPADTTNIINYAQMSLFSQQGQALEPKLEQALHTIWLEEPKNYMAGILLASSYTQSNATEQAALIWQQLLNTMPTNHPLYELVATTYQRMNNTGHSASNQAFDNPTPAPQTSDTAKAIKLVITIHIDQQIIDTLPTESRLFVLASPENSRMPIAVKRLALQPQQTVTLNDQDSMQGQSLSDYTRLNIKAIISTDGQATGEAADSLNQVIELDALDNPTIDISFDFQAHDAS